MTLTYPDDRPRRLGLRKPVSTEPHAHQPLSLEALYVEDKGITSFVAIDLPTSTNVNHGYIIDWDVLSQGLEGVTVQIDSDGDGVFEHSFTSDSELTQTEYLDAIQGPTPPVGGYSFPINGHTIARSLTSYFAIVMILIAAFVVVRRKKPRKKGEMREMSPLLLEFTYPDIFRIGNIILYRDM